MDSDYNPDYSSLSREDLIDVYENIDREKYPERFKEIVRYLGLCPRELGLNASFFVDEEFEELETTPEQAEINKARRIEEFFDSLSDTGSDYLSSSGGDAGLGGGDGFGSGD